MTDVLSEAHAHELDQRDPLKQLRELFHIPPSPAHRDGRPSIYLCGNSLGVMPKATPSAMERQLHDWGMLGVEGHFEGGDPWYPYHETLRDKLARLVGAKPHEVVAMNSLSVNLHLLMASFYRPSGQRRKIVIDAPCFPSDVYAVKSQLRFQGYDDDDLIWLRPRDKAHTLETSDIIEAIERDGRSIALVLLPGVNFVTGQFYDIPAITKATRAAGAVSGWDLAHAVGNVPLKLNEWGPDFAVWCSYKYLNSGPGAVGGAFVHERIVRDMPMEKFVAMPRFEGWWGNDPSERFKMEPEFEPIRSADAWALSNPPIFSMVPVKVSLTIFDHVGMDALREKSTQLTAYLERLIDDAVGDKKTAQIITPREPGARGCQLSLLITASNPRGVLDKLHAQGVLCDFREPNVIRVAPTPLYNTFHDCWVFAQALQSAL